MRPTSFLPCSVFLALVCALPAPLAAQQTAALVAASPAEISALPAAPLPQPVISTAQAGEKARAHDFFDKTNLRLFIAESLAQTGDLITTHRLIAEGGREADPLAKPFVNAGIGGQIVGSYVVGTGGTMLASYLLHRSGHHRLERWAPIVATVVESLATASNIHQLTMHYGTPAAYSITPAVRASSSPVFLRLAAGSH